MEISDRSALILTFVGACLVVIASFPTSVEEMAPLTPCPGPVCQQPVFEDMEAGVFEATGYAIGPPYASIVRSGLPVVNRGFVSLGDMEIFTVAVDPRVIPLGSVLWIEGLGLGMASDTGRLIKGRRIDICFRTMSQAWRYGRKPVDVVMLRRGK